jgi:MbtH protein
MTHPFEDNSVSYHVLKNARGQFSLWPEAIRVPSGWSTAYGPAGRADCLDFVERTWTDLRPAS